MRYYFLIILMEYGLMNFDAAHIENINVTNILHQYSLLCGPAFVDDAMNIWKFPKISEDVNICPVCSCSSDCFVYNNCCPDLEIQFSSSDCRNIIIYSSNNTIKLENKYAIVSKCPKGADTSLLHLCTKSRDIEDGLLYPPVTSTTYLLTFKNKFCALCNDIKQFIPWKLNFTCDIKFNFTTTVNEIVTTAIKHQCSISYIPGQSLSDKVKPCKESLLINKCNVTGTWEQYNRNVEYACGRLNNPLPPYRNIFCYMCNPPKMSQFVPIHNCNVTGLWEKRDENIDISCKNGGYSSATYPYKNIYCFMCNVDVSTFLTRKESWSVHVSPPGAVTYYFYHEDTVNSELAYTDTPIVKRFQPTRGSSTIESEPTCCKRMYKKWNIKLDCKFPIPFSFLENNMLRSALILNERSYCNLTRNVNKLYTICEKTNTTGCSTGSQLYIQWACETRQSQVFIKGVDRNFTLPKCGKHFENKIMFERRNPLQISTTVQSDLCKTFDCDDNQIIYPLQYFFCNCCSKSLEGSLIYAFDRSPWNIFSWSYYTTKCSQNEVFDTIQVRNCSRNAIYRYCTIYLLQYICKVT